MTTLISPFDAIFTAILDPKHAKNFSLFLYKPVGASRGEAVQKPYTLNVRPRDGTIGIHTHTYQGYKDALAYLSAIYLSGPHDEDEECHMWEIYGQMDGSEMNEWSEAAFRDDPAEPQEFEESYQEPCY
jgi:hypothetical protein